MKNTNKSYVKLMLKAIDVARTDVFDGYKSSKTDGLRAIRRFEEVNQIQFNPWDKEHVNKVSGCGHREAFFRRGRKILQIKMDF